MKVLRWFVPLLILCACGTQPLQAQPEPNLSDRQKAALEGTHVFRRILFEQRLTPIKEYNDLESNPEKKILIILGDFTTLKKLPLSLAQFLRKGGAALLASDRMIADPQVREQIADVAGVSISQETLLCLRREMCYRGLDFCPHLWMYPGLGESLFTDPRVTHEVETNVPSYLRRRRVVQGIRPILALPRGCAFQTPHGLEAPAEDPALFGVAGDYGPGRIMVLADHSLFINQMMIPRDTGNVEFTTNVLRWLRGVKSTRNEVLFIEDGSISERFDVPMKSASIPAEEALKMLFDRRNDLLVEAEKQLARMEDEDFFNRKFIDLLDDLGLSQNRITVAAMIISTVGLLLYLLYRVGIRGRYQNPAGVPPLTKALTTNLPDVPLIDQRARAQVREGLLAEPAMLLVRRWFMGLGVDVPPCPAKVPMPTIETTLNWWSRRRLTSRLQRLWNLATGQKKERLGSPGIWKLQRELEDLQAEQKQSGWRLTPSVLPTRS